MRVLIVIFTLSSLFSPIVSAENRPNIKYVEERSFNLESAFKRFRGDSGYEEWEQQIKSTLEELSESELKKEIRAQKMAVALNCGGYLAETYIILVAKLFPVISKIPGMIYRPDEYSQGIFHDTRLDSGEMVDWVGNILFGIGALGTGNGPDPNMYAARGLARLDQHYLRFGADSPCFRAYDQVKFAAEELQNRE